MKTLFAILAILLVPVLGCCEALGPELVTNGDMEANDYWRMYDTPGTFEQSSEQAHAGTYSWKVTTDSDDQQGIWNDTDAYISFVTGSTYRITVWVYPVGFTTGIRIDTILFN